jgi:hypothetical protein
MKISNILPLVFLVVLNSRAADLELRCSYEYEVTKSERESWFDANGIKKGNFTKMDNVKDKGKDVSYIKITYDDKGYFRLKHKSEIHSTNKRENEFNQWGKSYLKMTTMNKSDDDTFFIASDVIIDKDQTKIVGFIRYNIDRTSGAFEEWSRMETNIGKIDNSSPINIVINNELEYQSKGVCEKYSRKF